MVSLNIAQQVTMIEYLHSHKDTVIENWSQWRDAQTSNDVDKQLVDDVYREYMRTLDILIDNLSPF